MAGYDITGDLHGEGTKLTGLLEQLGYVGSDGWYGRPEHQAIFVGDLIDRGDQHADVLTILMGMVDASTAL